MGNTDVSYQAPLITHGVPRHSQILFACPSTLPFQVHRIRLNGPISKKSGTANAQGCIDN